MSETQFFPIMFALKQSIRYCIKKQIYDINKYNASSAMSQHLKQNLEEIKKGGLYKTERVIISPQDSKINIKESSKPVINFCANNYLGLSNNEELIRAAKDGLDSYGLGLSSVRFICGTQDIHLELEKKIAQFHEKDDSILFPACFDGFASLYIN